MHHIGTHHIQNFMVISVDPESITLQCIFAFNSTATGCLVGFTEVNDGYTWNLTLTKDRNQTSALARAQVMKSGNYSISVYDMVHGTCMCKEPAIRYGHIISLTTHAKATTLSTNTSKFQVMQTHLRRAIKKDMYMGRSNANCWNSGKLGFISSCMIWDVQALLCVLKSASW